MGDHAHATIGWDLTRRSVRHRHMWVFGYGSLMWDGWEQALGGRRVDHTLLTGFRRSFNKKSVANWGTSEVPGPTLGLERDAHAKCIGTAFDFPDESRDALMKYLKKREGKSFTLVEHPVLLPDGRRILAFIPVNDRQASTYIGHISLRKRAAMARLASGDSGACADYVRNIQQTLGTLGIIDADVDEFLAELDAPRSGRCLSRQLRRLAQAWLRTPRAGG